MLRLGFEPITRCTVACYHYHHLNKYESLVPESRTQPYDAPNIAAHHELCTRFYLIHFLTALSLTPYFLPTALYPISCISRCNCSIGGLFEIFLGGGFSFL